MRKDKRKYFTSRRFRHDALRYCASKGITFEQSPSNPTLLAKVFELAGVALSGPKTKAMERALEFIASEGVILPIACRKAAREAVKPDFYTSDAWRQVRYFALVANNGRCECCGSGKHDGVILHVDHIKPRSLYPEYALDPANLQVLCADCNLGKRAHDDTDWRAPSERKAVA